MVNRPATPSAVRATSRSSRFLKAGGSADLVTVFRLPVGPLCRYCVPPVSARRFAEAALDPLELEHSNEGIEGLHMPKETPWVQPLSPVANGQLYTGGTR